MKKSFSSESLARSALEYHNFKAPTMGWKIMKNVYFCPDHQAWHLSSMNQGEIRVQQRWKKSLEESGSKSLQRRERRFDYYLDLCQKHLLLEDGTYKKPTPEDHKEFMISLIKGRWPVKFKYVEMWWFKLPAHQKHNHANI